MAIPIRRVAALLLAGSLAVVMLPGPVVAHADLVTATPADGSVASQPVTEISATYTEALDPAESRIVVRDTSGAAVATGTVDPADATRMVATPASALGTGSYKVEWTAVAPDGHVERGTWAFAVAVATPSGTPAPTVAAGATVAPTSGPTLSTTSGPAAPASSTAPTPVPSAAGTTTSGDSDVVLPILVALVVLGAGAAYLLSRRNRPSDPR